MTTVASVAPMTPAGSTPEAGRPQGRELTSLPGAAPSSPSLGSPGGSGIFLGEVAAAPGRGRWEGVGSCWGVGRRVPSAGAPDPAASPAVFTEDGQPCRFPFRYGGRMLHSCTSAGSAHRKWWVLAGSTAAAPPPARVPPALVPCPCPRQPAHGRERVSVQSSRTARAGLG